MQRQTLSRGYRKINDAPFPPSIISRPRPATDPRRSGGERGREGSSVPKRPGRPSSGRDGWEYLKVLREELAGLQVSRVAKFSG